MTVVGLEVRTAPPENEEQWSQSFGTLDGGIETMRMAWATLEHKFAVRRRNETIGHLEEGTSDAKVVPGPRRYPEHLLKNHPVGLLVVERGHIQRPEAVPKAEEWEKLVEGTALEHRPKIIIESWKATALMWSQGPTSKGVITRWRTLGYATRCRRIGATQVGGAITQNRLLVLRIEEAQEQRWKWPAIKLHSEVARPMSNLLTPPGLVDWKAHIRTPGLAEKALDVLIHPMPAVPGALIKTEKGVRRVTPQEVGCGMGLPKGDDSPITPALLERTTSVFHWEYMSEGLSELKAEPAAKAAPVRVETVANESSNPAADAGSPRSSVGYHRT